MPTLPKKIAETFLARLADSKDVDSAKIEQLRALLAGAKKPKIDDLVKIFSLPPGGDFDDQT